MQCSMVGNTLKDVADGKMGDEEETRAATNQWRLGCASFLNCWCNVRARRGVAIPACSKDAFGSKLYLADRQNRHSDPAELVYSLPSVRRWRLISSGPG
jgi:hypothetical protein